MLSDFFSAITYARAVKTLACINAILSRSLKFSIVNQIVNLSQKFRTPINIVLKILSFARYQISSLEIYFVTEILRKGLSHLLILKKSARSILNCTTLYVFTGTFSQCYSNIIKYPIRFRRLVVSNSYRFWRVTSYIICL